MANSRKFNAKRGKRAQRRRLQASGQVSALARAMERVEGEEVRPPQHVLNLATAFRASMARQRGTLVTFEDKLLVLRVYANFILWKECNSHTEAVNLTATALQMCSANYSCDHSVYKKEVLTWAHQEVMRLLLEERKYVSYAELHRLVEERFDTRT